MDVEEVTPPVAGADVEGVSQETPIDAGLTTPEATPPAVATPSTATNNAPGAEFVTKQDFARMQSALQRRQSQIEQGHREREAQWQRDLDEARTKGMDEAQRKEYEHTKLVQENAQYRQYLQQVGQVGQEIEQMNGWGQWFQDRGVDTSKIDRSSTDAFLVSAWAALDERLGVKPGASAAAAQRKPATPITAAPTVVTATTTPKQGVSWKSVLAKYGEGSDDREVIYRKFENGDIPLSEMPA